MAGKFLNRLMAWGSLSLVLALQPSQALAQSTGEEAAEALLRKLPFLSESTDAVPSPDGRYTLKIAGPTGSHRLVAEIAKSKKTVDLMPVHRSVAVSWRPDGKLFFVNLTRGENVANCDIFDPSAKRPLILSLGNEAGRKLGLTSADELDDIARFRLSCVSWNGPDQVEVVIWWRDAVARERSEFHNRRLLYHLKTQQFARL